MRIAEVSTPLPLLGKGEPACHHVPYLTSIARETILAASLGPLRRAGRGWYGPDKRLPIHRRTVQALIAARLLYSPDPNTARITNRGRWCARTICSAIAGDAHAIPTIHATTP